MIQPAQKLGIPRAVMVIAIVVTIWQHTAMLFSVHSDGDEGVYTVLANEMNWDLSHYTTKDDKEISRFPYTCYRHDLFFHPPLYPLVLKTGFAIEPWSVKSGLREVLVRYIGIPPMRIGSRTFPLELSLVAFAFAVFVRVWALLVLGRLLRRWQTPQTISIVVLCVVIVCPITTFSTVRWHHDGLLGLLSLIAFALLCESLQTGSKSVFAGGLVAALMALNIRYNAILLAPCFLAIPFFDVFRRRCEAATEQATPPWLQTLQALPKWWWIFVSIAGLALVTIGLHHYARVYWHFGTLSPAVINRPSPEMLEGIPAIQRELGLEFLAGQQRRTLAMFGIETLLLVPILLLLALPQVWASLVGDLVQGRERGFILLVAFFVGGALTLILNSQVRYLAAALPMLYLFLTVALEPWPAQAWQQLVISLAIAGHATLASTSNLLAINLKTPRYQGYVYPSAYDYAPDLKPWVERTFGKYVKTEPRPKSDSDD